MIKRNHKQSILFFYHSPKDYLFRLYGQNRCPMEYFYGYFDLKMKGYHVDYLACDFGTNYLSLLNKILSKIFILLLGINIPVLKLPLLIQKARNFDFIICTSQEPGLLAAILKGFGLIDAQIAVISIGMMDQSSHITNTYLHLLKCLNRYIEKIICFSVREKENIQKRLDLSSSNIFFLPSQVDTDFFKPDDRDEQGNYILSVGYDRNRDWQLLIKAIEGLSIDLRIFTKKRFIDTYIISGKNYRFHEHVDPDVYRSWLQRAKFVVLPVRQNTYTAANTVLFECMSMGKAVIVSQTEALSAGYRLRNGYNCILVKPGDCFDLRKAILNLDNDPTMIRKLGHNARILATRYHRTDIVSERLMEIINLEKP